LPYLSDLIVQHESLFRKLFPDINPINKHHYLSHYCDCIRNSGPLRWLNCFRFEAKHRIFKRHRNICYNYKNIPKTMINICQISQCAIWGTGESPAESRKLEYSMRDHMKVAYAQSKSQLYELGLGNDDYIFKFDRMIIHGIEYRTELFVAIDSGAKSDDGNIVFGCIKEILLINNNQIYLWCEEWHTLYLEQSLNGYCICQHSEFRLINIDHLPDPKPFSIWLDYRTKSSYIVLRHMLS